MNISLYYPFAMSFGQYASIHLSFLPFLLRCDLFCWLHFYRCPKLVSLTRSLPYALVHILNLVLNDSLNFLATIGDCTDTLDSGAKCLPTCQVGTAELNSKAYHGEGERSCKKGKLTDTFKCVGDF